MTARDKYSQVATLMMGDAVQMIVKKATTRIPDGPKRKHLNILINYANRPDSEMSHLCKCVLNRIKKNHRMIAFKGLVLLNYLLVSCKKPDLYRMISSIPSVLSGPCFVDSTPEGAGITRRFLNYVDFVNEKSNFFRQLGYNLDSGPKKELQEIIENSPEHILQELNYGISCLEAISKQEIDFNAFHTKPTILGNVVLVKDLVRIYNCLKKRTEQIYENKNLFPEDAVRKLPDYMNKVKDITQRMNAIYTQALDMNIQSVVRLIESTRENGKDANVAANKKTISPDNRTRLQYGQNETQRSSDIPPPAYAYNHVGSEPNRPQLEKLISTTTKEDNLFDLDEIFGYKEEIQKNDLTDPFMDMGVQQNNLGGSCNPNDLNQSFFHGNPQSLPNVMYKEPFQDDLFGLQMVTEAPRNSKVNANQEPFNHLFDDKSQRKQPTPEVDPLDINLMIQRNLDFTSRNNNVFVSQQPAISNVVPAQGMTGYYNTNYNQFPQNPGMQNQGMQHQGMQYQGYNQQNPVAHPPQSMRFPPNQYQMNNNYNPNSQPPRY